MLRASSIWPRAQAAISRISQFASFLRASIRGSIALESANLPSASAAFSRTLASLSFSALMRSPSSPSPPVSELELISWSIDCPTLSDTNLAGTFSAKRYASFIPVSVISWDHELSSYPSLVAANCQLPGKPVMTTNPFAFVVWENAFPDESWPPTSTPERMGPSALPLWK